MQLVLGWFIGAVLVAATVWIHATAIRRIRFHWRRHHGGVARHIGALFIAHLFEVGVFAVGMYLTATQLQIGSLIGATVLDFHGYLYFSMATYTSLGLGDIYPTGELRLLTGLEVLTGLLMIGWSASFLFVEMHVHEEHDNHQIKQDQSEDNR
ncbi:MAG: hypothetical protein ACI9ON_001381 [Limisphaerales bacterium]|jgi:hypothetical protein